MVPNLPKRCPINLFIYLSIHKRIHPSIYIFIYLSAYRCSVLQCLQIERVAACCSVLQCLQTDRQRSRRIIQDSDFHSDNDFESHLLGNGLWGTCLSLATESTENAMPPKSTKSRNSNSSAQNHIKPKFNLNLYRKILKN